MKQLSDDERSALVKYRFERAHQTMKEAACMREAGFYNASVNRLYYACFYAAAGLLVSESIRAITHSGVKTMLSEHFVRTGRLAMEHGATFSTLFSKRQSGDYEDFMFCDAETVDFLTRKAEDFIQALETLVTI